MLLHLALVVTVVALCPDQTFLELPSEPDSMGPWPVSSKLIGQISPRNLTLEIWFPAVVGSNTSGHKECQYPIRDHMPLEQQKKIPDADNPNPFYENCYPGLPMDTTHGKYPLMVFVHGTAGFRTQSLHQMIHWASRGFIVAAADYPGIQLYDLLNKADHPAKPGPKTDQTGDTRLILGALKNLTDSRLAFLKMHMDLDKIAVSGHSAGAEAIQKLGDVADILIPMAGSGTFKGPFLESSLVLGAANDSVDGGGTWESNNAHKGYEKLTTPSPKRLSGVDRLGHHFCSDLCWIGADQGGIVAIAVRHGIYLAEGFKFLANDGCQFVNATKFAAPHVGWQFVNYATSAVLEGLFMCDKTMEAKLEGMASNTRLATAGIHVVDYEQKLL
jgi:hypothetical protein